MLFHIPTIRTAIGPPTALLELKMFAIEIDFNDGVSQPETILVRRPQVVIGASDYAHVVVEDLKEHEVELRVIRDKGRRLRCKPIGSAKTISALGLTDQIYENRATIKIGSLVLEIQALDSDLVYKEGEPPDRAGVRVLQSAASVAGPRFPAVMVFGQNPMVVSFSPKQTVTIGRSNQCLVRLDSPDVSSQHAKMGFEGGTFWIEDLGSTNGTFIDQQQIGGRTHVPAGVPVTIGRDISIVGLDSEEMGEKLLSSASERVGVIPPPPRRGYPAILCVSEGARPSRVVINQNSTLKIGRDPSSDMWLGVPHVSRLHCMVSRSHDNELVVKDLSTNGTYYDEGVLEKGDTLAIHGDPKVLDFGGGITVAICFNEDQERLFIESHGEPFVFGDRRSRMTRAGRGTKSLTAAAARVIAESANSASPAPEKPRQRGALGAFLDFVQLLDKRSRKFLYLTLFLVTLLIVLVAWLLLRSIFV